MNDKIQILVVDDHQVVREGLRHLLGSEEDMEFVGQGANSEEALFQLELLSPDVVLMDIKMPGMDGIELTKLVKEKCPSCNVIMLTLYDQYLTRAMAAGATGYLLKDTKREELAQAIRRVHNGDVVIGESITSRPRDESEEDYIVPGEEIADDTELEEVQLVIPPPVEANQLMRFSTQVEEVLQSRILQVVGSWEEGTALTLILDQAIPVATILNKLEGVSGIETIEQTLTNGKVNPKLLKKANATPRLKNRLRKTFYVTLEKERAGVNN